MTPTYDGLTWSHPRGLAPLTRLAALATEPGPLAVPHSRIRWKAHDLAGFESHPIEDLARRYDLIVLDHPGLGAAVQAGALVGLDDVFPPEDLAAWERDSLPGCYTSYHYTGHPWAAPIDAAAQVCAYRPDLLPQPPRTWDTALDLDAALTVAVPTRGPHTLLTYLGIAAAHDHHFAPDGHHLVPPDIAADAYDVLRRAVERTPPDLRDLDPIQLLDLTTETPIACVPLVFGYVTYSRPTTPVRFTDAPALTRGGLPGSVLGGTGLALSARARDKTHLLDHIRQVMHPLAQTDVIPDADGQPAAIAAWTDPHVNAASAGFYTGTITSVRHAWRRPRHPGWIAVQTQGSAILAAGIARHRPAADTLADLDRCYRTQMSPDGDR